MKATTLLALAFAAGLLGGVGGTLLTLHIQHQDREIIRAQRFELLNGMGKRIGFWGPGYNNQPVIIFGTADSPPDSRASLTEGALVGDRVALGLTGDANPFLFFRAKDGSPRVRLALDEFERPDLTMDDEWGARLGLGHERPDTSDKTANDWSLVFLPSRASIGMTVVPRNGRHYLKGYVNAAKDDLLWPAGAHNRP